MEETRILLIHTEETRNPFNYLGIVEDEPIEIEILYTVLTRQGHIVRIMDPDRKKENIEDVLSQFHPHIIYANGVVKQIYYMLEYVKRIKKYNKDIITVLGGVFAQYNYKMLESPYTDFICRSYDPYIFAALASNIKGIHNPDFLKDLNGLCWHSSSDTWVENDNKPFDINKLPDVDRSHFYQYKNFRLLKHCPLAQVRFAYSCSHHCTFCYRTMMNCGHYVHKDVNRFVSEIQAIKCHNIYIMDDNFLVSEHILWEFIQEVKARKLKRNFICYGRCDFILAHKDIIKELVGIGFSYFIVGFESLDREFLDKYHKKTSPAMNEACIRFMKSIHAGLYAMMIIDLDFTPRDFRKMYLWSKKNDLEYVIPSIYTPLPGTKVYEECKDSLLTHDFRKWDYTHVLLKPAHMSARAFMFHYYVLAVRLVILSLRHGSFNFINIPARLMDFLFGRK